MDHFTGFLVNLALEKNAHKIFLSKIRSKLFFKYNTPQNPSPTPISLVKTIVKMQSQYSRD